jgi:hypothetical protein
MHFEWDESKNRTNREKHGLDFEVVFVFDWENALVADRTRQSEGEQRYAALGVYSGKIHTVVFARRGLNIRIVSLRRSNRQGRKGLCGG